MVTEITITVVTLPFLSVASKQGDEFFEVQKGRKRRAWQLDLHMSSR